ncbi:MAG: tyrosine-type recombinase/integrase [Patescibacteria group bacterium]|nr:tyrosine-type recombinase/integrase [Patescibacteria group bacterium]
MTLENLAARYALERDVEPGTHAWLKYVARRYGRFLGYIPTVADLNDDSVNAWLASLLEAGLARPTVKGYRGALVMLWRYAAEIDENQKLPRRLRRVKAPKPIPTAWTMQEVGLVLAQAKALTGYYRCGVGRAEFWVAVVLALWDSGVRIGDLLKLKWDDIGEGGVVVIRQRKTEWPVRFRFQPNTLAAMRAIERKGSRYIFGGVVCRKWLFVTFKSLAKSAGLTGTTKKIRKSAATAVEGVQRGAASQFLGHKTTTMARDHYVDIRLLPLEQPSPPPLDHTA